MIGHRFELPVFNTSLEHESELPDELVVSAQKVHTEYERVSSEIELDCQHISDNTPAIVIRGASVPRQYTEGWREQLS